MCCVLVCAPVLCLLKKSPTHVSAAPPFYSCVAPKIGLARLQVLILPHLIVKVYAVPVIRFLTKTSKYMESIA